jgi:hypothetical protein
MPGRVPMLYGKLLRFAGLLALSASFTGCLLTLGAPLARRVEEDRWVLEAGGGAMTSTSFDHALGMGYLYAGRAIGADVEVGMVGWFLGDATGWIGAVTLPVEWDPLPRSWPVGILVGAAPGIFLSSDGGMEVGLVPNLGIVASPLPWLELFVSGSTLVPSIEYYTVAAGLRCRLRPSIQLGCAAMYTNPDILTASVSVGTLLEAKH